MTKDQFQRETHDFIGNKAEAEALAAKYNEIGVEGDTIVAVCFDGQWCVMLKMARDFVKGAWGF